MFSFPSIFDKSKKRRTSKKTMKKRSTRRLRRSRSKRGG